MFKKVRWQALVVILGFVGCVSTSVATDDMEKSFDAAETGNFKQAVAIWNQMANDGDPQAQFNLGLMYHAGLGMPRNEKEAVNWYHKAAEGGYTPAQVYLVVGYEEGWFGLPQNKKRADYWRGFLSSDD